MTITTEQFDAAAAPEEKLRELYDFEIVIEQEREPDDPTAPFDLAVLGWREPPSWAKYPRWMARDNGELVGVAFVEFEYLETNRHLAWFDIAVRADRRREGIGSQLLKEIAETSVADGRTVLGTYVGGRPEDGVDDGFLLARGFEKRMVERRSRLLTAELDRPMLEEWVARAKERAGEYSLIGFDDVCPDDLVDAYVTLNDVMNTAPRENLDMEDYHWTPERLREAEVRRARHRRHQWTIVARHDPSGEMAGFTEVTFADWMGDLMWQGDTGVDPKHREKGLGRWLKAAMALRILDERPEIARIDTWNAGSNRPMLAINVAMGFRPLKYYGDWQKNIGSEP
jgi:mycothiol synthase